MGNLFPFGKNKKDSDNLVDSTRDLIIDGEYNEFLNGSTVCHGPTSEFLCPAISERRLSFILFLCLSAFFILILRTGYLQIIKGAYYHEAAEGNRIRTQIVPSWRGIIYDRNEIPLVKNIPTYSISITPLDMPKDADERKNFLTQLSEIIDVSPEEIIKLIDEYEGPRTQAIPIKEDLEHNMAITLIVRSMGLKGVSLDIETRREYLLGSNEEGHSLSHLLGYEGKINKEEYEKLKDDGYLFHDHIGKTGIELSYENILRGQYGRKQIEVDASGHEKNIIAKEYPIDGKNIVLTIDYELQKKLENIIISYLRKLGKRKASAIVMNPKNGEILAMVSTPFFSNNDFSAGILKEKYSALLNDEARPLFNRAISGEYPPGSTIKPIIASAGLEENIISISSTILSLGGIQVSTWFFPDWKVGGHGVTDVKKAIAESVNTFFYYIGGGYGKFEGLGVERIGKYLKLFGVGEKLGINLNGEAAGFVPTKAWKEKQKGEQWYIGDTYHLSIGQGDVLITPLQVASYTSVFANGGTLYKPQIVKIFFKDNYIEEVKSEIIRNNFILESNINIVRQGMRQTVTVGSARSLNDLGISVAGKTGTAQWSSAKQPHAWFTGFAPFDDPEIVITVLVEEAGEGSSISVPIAKEFLRWYFYK